MMTSDIGEQANIEHWNLRLISILVNQYQLELLFKEISVRTYTFNFLQDLLA